MPDNRWIASPQHLQQDEALATQVPGLFRRIYETEFADEPLLNHALPIEIRAIRDIGEWRLFLLLTPWMLSRLYLRFEESDIAIPEAWRAGNRAGKPHVVLGPPVTLTLFSQDQKCYLNYHPELGHHLVQPLIMRMESFGCANEVYASWNEVIATRNENMKQRQRECQWQQEVSRREFFTRLRGSGERSGL
jgi:hypothetical protein